MRGPGREEKAAAALLRTARVRASELQSRLADVEAAIETAGTSLKWLAEAVGAEKEARGADLNVAIEFARFLEGANEKRKSLESTRETLSQEKRSIEALLSEARAEMAKLEHLIQVSRRAAEKREQQLAAPRFAGGSLIGGRNAV